MNDSVLIISAVSPVPVDSGKRMILRGLLGYFVERLGPENVHYALLGQPGDERPDFPGVAHRLDKPSSASQLSTLARRFATSRSYTAQEAMLGSSSLRRQIRDLVSWLSPTIEVYDTLRLGQHAPASSCARRRVLYLDDLFSERYDRMLNFDAVNEVSFDPLGEFAANVPAPLRALVRKPAIYRPVLRMERDRIRRREDKLVHDFDASLLVNQHEVNTLRIRSSSTAVHAINGLLPTVIAPARQPATPPEFVFLGRMNLPHNDDAICAFLRICMPDLLRRMPGATVRLIGKGASKDLLALASRYPHNVRVEGFVEDLEPVFATATASLAPLRFGSGIKIKMLETFALGVPVLATGVAIDGIPASPDGSDGCIVEDNLAAWPEILASMADTGKNALLSKAGLEFFSRTYGQDLVMAQYDEIFDIKPAAAL